MYLLLEFMFGYKLTSVLNFRIRHCHFDCVICIYDGMVLLEARWEEAIYFDTVSGWIKHVKYCADYNDFQEAIIHTKNIMNICCFQDLKRISLHSVVHNEGRD